MPATSSSSGSLSTRPKKPKVPIMEVFTQDANGGIVPFLVQADGGNMTMTPCAMSAEFKSSEYGRHDVSVAVPLGFSHLVPGNQSPCRIGKGRHSMPVMTVHGYQSRSSSEDFGDLFGSRKILRYSWCGTKRATGTAYSDAYQLSSAEVQGAWSGTARAAHAALKVATGSTVAKGLNGAGRFNEETPTVQRFQLEQCASGILNFAYPLQSAEDILHGLVSFAFIAENDKREPVVALALKSIQKLTQKTKELEEVANLRSDAASRDLNRQLHSIQKLIVRVFNQANKTKAMAGKLLDEAVEWEQAETSKHRTKQEACRSAGANATNKTKERDPPRKIPFQTSPATNLVLAHIEETCKNAAKAVRATIVKSPKTTEVAEPKKTKAKMTENLTSQPQKVNDGARKKKTRMSSHSQEGTGDEKKMTSKVSLQAQEEHGEEKKKMKMTLSAITAETVQTNASDEHASSPDAKDERTEMGRTPNVICLCANLLSGIEPELLPSPPPYPVRRVTAAVNWVSSVYSNQLLAAPPEAHGDVYIQHFDDFNRFAALEDDSTARVHTIELVAMHPTPGDDLAPEAYQLDFETISREAYQLVDLGMSTKSS